MHPDYTRLPSLPGPPSTLCPTAPTQRRKAHRIHVVRIPIKARSGHVFSIKENL